MGLCGRFFFRVHRMEIESVMLVFSTQLCELLALLLSPCLVLSPSPPSLCEYVSKLYTRIQSVRRGEYWVIGEEGASHR
jgi:hypothetical protein